MNRETDWRIPEIPSKTSAYEQLCNMLDEYEDDIQRQKEIMQCAFEAGHSYIALISPWERG